MDILLLCCKAKYILKICAAMQNIEDDNNKKVIVLQKAKY
jgi:hypothetical protein